MSVVDQEQVLDYIFSSLYSIYSLIGIILNSFLLGLIVFYKQTSLKEYRILLGNTTCSLLLLSLLNFFLQLRPEDQLQRYGNYCGLPDAKNAFVLYLIVVICSIGVGSYMVMIAAGVKIRSYVLSSYNKMSPQSSKAFNMMVKALVIQSFMPVFFSFPTKILYLLAQFTSFHSIIAEYLMFAMSPIVAVVDPCITLYYILPYRKFITSMLGFSKREASSKVLSTDIATKASIQPFALKSIAD
ncbi:unnamed protein product [Nippostrongylus brasiliensis]|uniref:G_PROTEIN_RECEP_F1_2 domain-containing protein n=1 Tax=Nippostrongylus brasiliensis TaxID=27835 RepID=A0A0N4Y9Z6_NIPBR|nr:unnamed protein product [Nippostrongylus brasiliensis]